MWHLRSDESGVSLLFHTVSEAANWLLGESRGLWKYQIAFIPIWEAATPKSPSDSAKQESVVPIPLSRSDF